MSNFYLAAYAAINFCVFHAAVVKPLGWRPSFSLNAEATSPDGIIEAIESTRSDWFAMGTQFHPESETATAIDIRVFEEFICGITGEVIVMEEELAAA